MSYLCSWPDCRDTTAEPGFCTRHALIEKALRALHNADRRTPGARRDAIAALRALANHLTRETW